MLFEHTEKKDIDFTFVLIRFVPHITILDGRYICTY